MVLERWTNLLEFLASPTRAAGTLGLNVPWKPLELSAGLEKYLAAELPLEFAEEFRKHVTSGNQMAAFQQMQLLFDGQVVNRLEEIRRLLSPPDPLKPIRDFPRETHIRNDLGILKAHYRAVPFIGREGDLQSLFEWLNGPGAFSFQVVCGRGGTFQIQPLDAPRVVYSLDRDRGEYKQGTHEIGFDKFTRYIADAADMARILRGEKECDFSYTHDLAVQETVLLASGVGID